MFLGWKNQYCENDYIARSSLKIQCEPYQIINGIFHRTRRKNFTIYMETQKTPNSQSSLEKEEWGWKSTFLTLDYITMLQSSIQSMLHYGASLMAQMVKNLPAMQETQIKSLGWEDP